MGLAFGENFTILTSAVCERSTHVTDEQTDERAYRALSICYMLSRAKKQM